jgi:hypothetical protein
VTAPTPASSPVDRPDFEARYRAELAQRERFAQFWRDLDREMSAAIRRYSDFLREQHEYAEWRRQREVGQ